MSARLRGRARALERGAPRSRRGEEGRASHSLEGS